VQNAPAVQFWAAASRGFAATHAEVTSAEQPEKRWQVFSLFAGAIP
jgi:hypothetical protein